MRHSEASTRVSGGKLNRIVNVAILVALVVVLLQGQAGSRVKSAIDGWRTSRTIAESWPALIEASSRLVGDRVQTHRTIVEFIDYECAYCRSGAAKVFESISDEEVDVVIRHLPLEAIHPHARPAAQAAICGERFGVFAEAHASLLSEDKWMSQGDWDAWGVGLGIEDIKAFRECLVDDATTERIDEDARLAGLLGVTGTPGFVTTRRVFLGDFEAALASLPASPSKAAAIPVTGPDFLKWTKKPKEKHQ